MLLGLNGYEDTHLNISFARRQVEVDGAPVTLTRKEYELLALLAQNAGEIVSRDALLRQVWGYSEGVRTRTLDVHIRRVRKKLAPFTDQYIETIFGVGYRFQPYRQRTNGQWPVVSRQWAVLAG
jgi:DNA-binding response OmpR family regulator